jgi:hypothetical protein
VNKSILKPVLASLALLVASAGLTAPTLASGGSGSGGSTTASRGEVRLEARMRSGRTESKVAWRSDRGRLKVQAEIYRGKPNTKYTVSHKGKTIAVITTNAAGNGRVEMERTSIKMAAGEAVAVGAMKGTLVRIR